MTLKEQGHRFCISPDKQRGMWISPIEYEKIYQDWADHTDTPEKEFIEFLQDLSESPVDTVPEQP